MMCSSSIRLVSFSKAWPHQNVRNWLSILSLSFSESNSLDSKNTTEMKCDHIKHVYLFALKNVFHLEGDRESFRASHTNPTQCVVGYMGIQFTFNYLERN